MIKSLGLLGALPPGPPPGHCPRPSVIECTPTEYPLLKVTLRHWLAISLLTINDRSEDGFEPGTF